MQKLYFYQLIAYSAVKRKHLSTRSREVRKLEIKSIDKECIQNEVSIFSTYYNPLEGNCQMSLILFPFWLVST